jgi:nucleoside-diphosphate-sugar epimerase
MRDLLYGPDLVQALARSMEADLPGTTVLNIGSGSRLMIQEIAAWLQELLHCEQIDYALTDVPDVVRHRFADISRARHLLGYHPEYDVLDGLKAFSSAMLE